MGFFKKLFGQEDDPKNDYSYIDQYLDDNDDEDYEIEENDSNSPETYFSIEKVKVVGFDKLDEEEKDYIKTRLKKGTRVYLRYDFDSPNVSESLQVYRHSHLLGNIEPNKAESLHAFLRDSKIGDIIVTKIEDDSLELDVYIKDDNGDEPRPDYPIEDRQIDVVEVNLWKGQEDWSEDWYMNPFTDELSYRYNEMYDDDDDIDNDEKIMVDVWFTSWLNSYLDGTCITKKGSEEYINYLNFDSAKEALRKRIDSYLENKGLHFAEKELFSDRACETDAENDDDSLPSINTYKETYKISYTDGEGKIQSKTIKNGNFFTFIAGLKYRDNWEELVDDLSDDTMLQLKPEPENEIDSNAIAVYNEDTHLGYIPQKDIPIVRWCMEDDILDVEIEYIDDDYVSLIIPATFKNLIACDKEVLEGLRFYKTERTKYEGMGFVTNDVSIPLEEFIEGIKS